MSGWIQSLSNVYNEYSPFLTIGGWVVAFTGAGIAYLRRQWIFRDKATLAQERDLAIKESALSAREADFATRRAELAEGTVSALGWSIDTLRSALTTEIETLTGEIEGLRTEVKTLQHKTFVQTRFIRDLMACITAGAPMPEVPEELRDDVASK